MAFAGVEYVLFELCSLLCLLAEACRYYYEGLYAFVFSQAVYCFGAHVRWYYENSQVGGRQFAYVVKCLYALHFVFIRVDNAQNALVASVDNVAHDGASGFVNVV